MRRGVRPTKSQQSGTSSPTCVWLSRWWSWDSAFWWIRTGDGVWGILAGTALAVFVAVLVWHQRLRARRDGLRTLAAIRQHAIDRVQRHWSDLPVPLDTSVPADHPFALDLDLTGRGSLLHLMDTSHTPAGRSTLQDWLLNGSTTEEVLFRQRIAADLVPERDWREDLQVAGATGSGQPGDPRDLIDWLERAAHCRLRFRHALAAAMAVVTLAGIILSAVGLISFGLVIPAFVVNGAISFLWPRAASVNELNTHQRAMRQYRRVLPVAERLPGSRPETLLLRSQMLLDGRSASEQLARLDRTLSLVIPPSTILWVPLQLASNWDVLVDASLTNIARQIGPHVRGWIASIGQVEAIAGFATLADLNPGWTWPEVTPGGSSLQASELGHPLIPENRRVPNDISLGPSGTVLVVTGSNMAGKSTLLRSIGLNAVLARAGGPVCAAGLSVPNQPIWSSVRIQDSLEQGVSLYMAELLRLKSIVDAAQAGPITYLLDEILHGTNTTERRIAARTVIRKLLATDSIGAVSTHDLELVDAELAAHATCVHLVDQVSESEGVPGMTFDYKVRPGLAPTSNALRLLELVGLGE